MSARDDLKLELRTHLDLAAKKLGTVTAALDASVVEAELDVATGDIRKAILLTDGLAAMQLQVPRMDKEERDLGLPQAYADFRMVVGQAHARLLAAVDTIEELPPHNPPYVPPFPV